jgi:hypothetical protein
VQPLIVKSHILQQLSQYQISGMSPAIQQVLNAQRSAQYLKTGNGASRPSGEKRLFYFKTLERGEVQPLTGWQVKAI